MTVPETGSAWAETPALTKFQTLAGRGDAPVGTYVTVGLYEDRTAGIDRLLIEQQAPSGQGGVAVESGNPGPGAYYTYVTTTSGATARSENFTL